MPRDGYLLYEPSRWRRRARKTFRRIRSRIHGGTSAAPLAIWEGVLQQVLSGNRQVVFVTGEARRVLWRSAAALR